MAASSSSQRPSYQNTETIKRRLEELQVAMINLLNERNWDHDLWKYFNPKFTEVSTFRINNEAVTSFPALIEAMKSLTISHPEYRVEPITANAAVDEAAGKATVWLFCRVTGIPTGLQWEVVNQYHWKVLGHQWQCYKHEGLKSAAVITDNYGQRRGIGG